MQDCIFCKIANGEIPAEKVAETDNVLAFFDNKPSADTHILVVPKKHIPNFLAITDEDKEIINEVFSVAREIIKEKKIEGKYRIVFNGGSYQVVPHLHMHILGGELKEKIG